MEKQLDNREVKEQDTVLLPGVSEYRENIQDCINKLGEVLNELTVRESLDDPDTLGWQGMSLKPECILAPLRVT